MKKLFIVLALTLPLTLMAQEAKEEVKEEVAKQEVKGCCQISKQSRGDRGDMQRRMGMQRANKERKKGQKKQQIRQVVRLAVVGGLAYYIGYHQGEEHFNGGMMKRRPGMGDRK